VQSLKKKKNEENFSEINIQKKETIQNDFLNDYQQILHFQMQHFI